MFRVELLAQLLEVRGVGAKVDLVLHDVAVLLFEPVELGLIRIGVERERAIEYTVFFELELAQRGAGFDVVCLHGQLASGPPGAAAGSTPSERMRVAASKR